MHQVLTTVELNMIFLPPHFHRGSSWLISINSKNKLAHSIKIYSNLLCIQKIAPIKQDTEDSAAPVTEGSAGPQVV